MVDTVKSVQYLNFSLDIQNKDNFFASLIPDLKRRRKLIEAVLIFRIMPLRYLIVIVYAK
jgi:hypothetical protein